MTFLIYSPDSGPSEFREMGSHERPPFPGQFVSEFDLFSAQRALNSKGESLLRDQ